VTQAAWIEAALTSARPQAVAALLRYFRDLDIAEEAFQDACLRALKTWPKKGPPRDPTAWLVFVGRNVAIDAVRRRSKLQELPPEETLSDLDDTESELVEHLDSADYRDDLLRLLFVCCHPDFRRRSRSHWRCASCPASRCNRSPARFWSAKLPWSNASRAPRTVSP
jgi:RNA polymerase sigma-70 factor, ECF subfamily